METFINKMNGRRSENLVVWRVVNICQIKEISKKYLSCQSDVYFIGIKWRGKIRWLCQNCWNKIPEDLTW